MTPFLALFKKELRSFFNSPIAYIIIIAYLLITGFFFFRTFFVMGEASMRGMFDITPLVYVFFGPAVSMRLISEEKRSGSIEMLVTLPVSDLQILLAKYLAAVSVLTLATLLTLAYPFSMALFGIKGFAIGPMIGGYAGLIFLGGTYAAMGLMASTFSNNQVVAFIIALFVSLVLFLIGLQGVVMFLPSSLAGMLQYLSTGYHFENISRGVIDSRDVLYYLSLIIAAFLVSRSAMEKRTWA